MPRSPIFLIFATKSISNSKDMKTRFLLGALLLFVCSLAGCSDDDNNGGNNGNDPFSLEKTYYEVRLEHSAIDIPIINGSRDISLSVADETILEANKILNEGGCIYVSLQGKKKGNTTLTLTDNVTGDKETIEVKVTDCYIAYDIIASNHPALNEEMTLFLINNEARDCYFWLKDNPSDRPSATGTYDFFVTLDSGTGPAPQSYAIPHLRLSYPSNADGEFADGISTHDFQIELYGENASSPYCTQIIEAYLGIDWEELIANALTKSPAPVDQKLRMTVPGTDYVITGVLSTVAIPEHVLD